MGISADTRNLENGCGGATNEGVRRLLTYPFDPASLQVQAVLSEKGLAVEIDEHTPGTETGSVLALNPAGTLPILQDEPPTGGEIRVCPVGPILEYLEEAYPVPALMPSTSAGRAEVRRLIAWFNDKFDREVHPNASDEYIRKRLMRRGLPDPSRLRDGREAIAWHLDYINWLTEQRAWIAGEKMTLADLVCASHILPLDYCDLIVWNRFACAREWYARLKSRPAIRQLLTARVPGLPASRYFDNPDF